MHQANDIARPVKASFWSSIAVLCPLLLLGCSGQPPTVLLDTPGGPTPIYSLPPPGMPGGLVGPPPGLENSALPASSPPAPSRQTGSRNGNYVGTAEPLQTGGGLCLNTRQVSGFHVRGNSVRYGGFRGTIDPNNGLQMVYGQDWIIGQFEGATFHGQLAFNGRFGNPGCTYVLNLQHP